MIPLEWHEQHLELFAEKALFWRERRTLIATDTHFGKAAFFRSKGVPVPEQVTDADLERLDQLLARTNAERFVILGDFFHAKGGRARQTLAKIKAWRDRHAALEILLIRGNHDDHAGDPPRSWRIRSVDPGFVDAPFVFAHEPETHDGGYVLAGHVHPAVCLNDIDGSSLRLPCFSFGPRIGLLPSFGSFTGSWTIRPGEKDRIFAVAPGEIVEIR